MTHASLPEQQPELPEQPEPSTSATPQGDAEHGSSRRTFLAGAGAATVLGAAVATGVGVVTAGAAAAATQRGDADGAGGDAVVAYLRDPARGEVHLLSGEREVVVHDPALARTLTRHLGSRADGQER